MNRQRLQYLMKIILGFGLFQEASQRWPAVLVYEETSEVIQKRSRTRATIPFPHLKMLPAKLLLGQVTPYAFRVVR